ncbi:MAG: SRPBCC domain-containing protein [Gammaproteobacteria bacterium]|nr:SRPBCC domain-containing protein [Gammaproteobacteria bacterium]
MNITAKRLLVLVPLAAVLAGAGGAVHGKVAAQDAAGFVISHEMTVAGTPKRVFVALTDEIARWWDPDHSYSGQADNLFLDARAGGCFCERLGNGGSVEHMRVVFASPGRLLRLTGGLGPLQGMGASGSMDFNLRAAGDAATRLELRYIVSGFSPDGLGDIAGPVDAVLANQLARLTEYLDSVH